MIDTFLALCFAIVAVLYSAVGQAGGTGYIAVMGLASFSPEVIKPIALMLNVLVAGIGCFRFSRAGLMTARTCYPFAILGVPFSVIGGALNLPHSLYQPVVGVLLLLAALVMFRSVSTTTRRDEEAQSNPPFVASLIAGGGIGFISGVTGVGGGIFLAPVLLALGWVATRQTSAVSAAFNLLNSAAALAGMSTVLPVLPAGLAVWLPAVGLGALAGSWLGANYLPSKILRMILTGLLLIAGLRMVTT